VSQSDPDWDAIFREYLPRVYNYFLYRVNNRQIAEDLSSETFGRVWANRDKYREDIAGFSTWLFTIAHHVAVDFYRKQQPKLIAIEDVYHLSSSDKDTPEKIIQAKFEKEQLARLIADLPEREQDIISLKYGAGFSHQEIAELLSISESNVGTIVHRAVKQIRRLLMQEERQKHG
jgi:RNA polymerase sigma-70 factor (ECF subfamily)